MPVGNALGKKEVGKERYISINEIRFLSPSFIANQSSFRAVIA